MHLKRSNREQRANEAATLTWKAGSVREVSQLKWNARVFETFGLRICLRASCQSLLHAVLSRAPECIECVGWGRPNRTYSVVKSYRREDGRCSPQYLLYVNQHLLASAETHEELLECFESDLDLYVAANAPERLFVHAGAVGWKNQTVLIPGRSGSGKTSLVSEFLKHGATYYSDDWAVIDPNGLLHPYPRKLSIRGNDGIRRRVEPEEFGALRGKPSPISTILITGYTEGARWIPQSTSPGTGLLTLMANTPSARTQPKFAMTVLHSAIAIAEVYQARRGDKEETVEGILTYLEQRG